MSERREKMGLGIIIFIIIYVNCELPCNGRVHLREVIIIMPRCRRVVVVDSNKYIKLYEDDDDEFSKTI